MDQPADQTPGLLAFGRMLFFTPSAFFRQYLAPGAPRPYWWLVTSLFFINILLATLLADDSDPINSSVSHFLGRIIGKALFNTLFLYFFFGWCGKLIIWMCGGKASVRQARSLLLYTGVFNNITTLLLGLYASVLLSIIGPSNLRLLAISGLSIATLYIICISYGLHISYCAFMTLPGVKRGRARFLHFYLPRLVVIILILLAGHYSPEAIR